MCTSQRPTVVCLPLNPSALGKLRRTWHISSEPGTHTLGRLVREAKLQTKLVERSSGKGGPKQFPHPEVERELMDPFGK